MKERPIRTDSKLISKPTQTKKISLKRTKLTTQVSQMTEKSTACNSVHYSCSKKSVKDLFELTRMSVSNNEHYLSMSYQDIRCPPSSQPSFFQNLFCAQKRKKEIDGCPCEPKCIWMNYWLSLSSQARVNRYLHQIAKSTEDQIRKDILRTQPQIAQFSKLHYQQALFQCLMSYARLDPEIGYVQGMNIICSVIIFHGSSFDQCQQVFQFIMMGCEFRKLLQGQFEFGYRITDALLNFLKSRCYDLFAHIVERFEINLTQFVIGWLIPLMGNVVPLKHMHLVINAFVEKGWAGVIKIILALFLYLKNEILQVRDENQLMQMLCVQKLRQRHIDWEELIKSSANLKNIYIPMYE